MLRVLHTADWHLGQSLHGHDRDYEHGRFLAWLLATIIERRPDALLIAGDVFDSVNPPAVAQRRFYDFLAQASRACPAMQMVVIAGNHDAAARLEAPAGLLEGLGISTVGVVSRDEAGEIDLKKFLVPLKDADGRTAALALAIPFLRSSDVPLLAEAADPYLDGIRELYHRTVAAAVELRDREHPGTPLLALGHCHWTAGKESESERRLVVGTSEALRGDTFPASLSYVALGHLHLAQKFDGGRIRYSGSPIPLSFSEHAYRHSVLELTFHPEAPLEVTELPIPRAVGLLRLPTGKALPIGELLVHLAGHPFDDSLAPEVHPFLEVRVLDDGPDPTRRRRIEQALEGKPVRLASIKAELPPRKDSVSTQETSPLTLDDLHALDPVEMMEAAHRERYQVDPDPTLLSALREILLQESAAALPEAP